MASVALEIGVRILGYRSWRRFEIGSNEPVMYEPDPVLGWRNKPGHYRYAGYGPQAPDIEVTILGDGSRTTGEVPSPDAPEVILIGCSFAFGHALDDRESLGWQLQQRLPAVSVRNHAVTGFGTVQALLRLEEVLATSRRPPIVIYGLVESHEFRSVAHPDWLLALAKFSRSGMAAVPWARLGADGRLERHPPLRYPAWPLRDHSALLTLLEARVEIWRSHDRLADPWGVAKAAIREMDSATRSHGGRFLLAPLYESPKAMPIIRSDLAQAGIRIAECGVKQYPLPIALRVSGESHPNGLVNADWADCLAGEVAATLRSGRRRATRP
ncbi:MAG: hypothetical protein ACREQQ_13625 [Candidatus Binatia bacterium]